jgi:DNA-binding MltR family transcriptional regulator
MAAIISNLKLMDDAGIALMGAAYLDHALELLLKSQFRPLSPDDERRLFDGAQNGILGTFSAKIRMAYAIGLLLDELYHDLLLINGIRNAFAHSLHNDVFFTNDLIIADCEKLSYVKRLARVKKEQVAYMLPVHLFVETVQYIYTEFRRIVDNKQRVFDAMRQVIATMEQSQSAEPPPSEGGDRQGTRRSRRRRPEGNATS